MLKLCAIPDVYHKDLLLSTTDLYFSNTMSGKMILHIQRRSEDKVENTSMVKVNNHEHFSRVFTTMPMDLTNVASYLKDPKTALDFSNKNNKRKLASNVKTIAVSLSKKGKTSTNINQKESTAPNANEETRMIVARILGEILQKVDDNGGHDVSVYGDLFDPF